MNRTRWKWVARQAGSVVLLALGLMSTEVLAQCAYSSIQARFQLSSTGGWVASGTVIQGQRFKVGVLVNGGSTLAAREYVALRLTGPSGFEVRPPVNGVYVEAPYSGTYTFEATCNNSTLTSSATLTADVPSTGTPVQRPNLRAIGFRSGTELYGGYTGNQTQIDAWDRASLEKVVEAGAVATHVGFSWSDIEPVRGGGFNWTGADAQYALAREKGLVAFAFSGMTPLWALPAGRTAPHKSPPDPQYTADFQYFFRELSARYCHKIRYYEFWNEQNGCGWIDDQCSNGQQAQAELYADWLKLWYVAMKEGCPDVVLATGGLDCASYTGPTACADYIGWIYNRIGGEYFDAVSIHPYGQKVPTSDADPYLNIDALQNVRGVMVNHGQPWKKIWADEWGYNTPATLEGLKGRMIERALNWFEDPTHDYVFQSRYLTVQDTGEQPVDHNYGLCDINASVSPPVLTPRTGHQAYREHVLGVGGTVLPLQNATMEFNTTPQYGGLANWGPNGGWANHEQYARPANQFLGQMFGFYSAGTAETVGQLLPNNRFQAGKTYVFKSWVHGGGDNTGVVPFQLGYAQTDGSLSSWAPLATQLYAVGNTWYEAAGVSFTVPAGSPAIGKQIIVRFGKGSDGGMSDIWFDNLSLTMR
ncbi:carbohydrate binding domain-containing protein [Myxococcaceae bacterium JPH2]|nr:carbohydrate binding domain-containing protein [Myxococcaceae bacterium JPH2]